jgi:hypothetical protein
MKIFAAGVRIKIENKGFRSVFILTTKNVFGTLVDHGWQTTVHADLNQTT